MVFIVERASFFEDMHYTVLKHNRIASTFLDSVPEFPGPWELLNIITASHELPLPIQNGCGFLGPAVIIFSNSQGIT